ncbi:MAG: amidohydrolase family protein [Frondihabitans sp.]|nr:amidohydrolase family protein [Frondihabitans sp.]
MADLRLVGGRVVTPDGIVEGGLAIDDGVIVAIGPTAALPSATETVDLGGDVALPGMIDPHVHLGVGGTADDAKFLEDMTTETTAAAIGGVTTIVTDHENAGGPSWVTTLLRRHGTTLLDLAKRELGGRSPIDVRFTANPCTDEHLREIATLVDEGVTSFKMFPSYVGEEAAEFGITTVDYAYIFQAFEQIAAAERPDAPAQGMVHCEEPTICGMLRDRYRAMGHESLQWWTRARPAGCEAMQIFDVGMIAKETGARAYIPHVSSEEGGRTIEYLHSRGARVVAETCAHYLIPDVPWGIGALAKINPPLRDPGDVEWMWSALGRGSIEIVGSDNCRYCLAEKRAKSMWDAIPGVSEIGATLAILLTEGVAKGRLSWEELARVAAENAARRFGMYPKKGALMVGADGDVVVVDPQARWRLGSTVPLSGADFSMYEGREAIGRPWLTVSRGRVVAEHGASTVVGGGQYVSSGALVSVEVSR